MSDTLSPPAPSSPTLSSPGLSPAFSPDSDAQLAEAVAWAAAHGRALDPRGSGSKRALGRPVPADALPLDLGGLSGILDYQPAELVLTARAGTRWAEIAAVLDAAGQHLACEPPDLRLLLGGTGTGTGTLGGLVSANLSGPRRLSAGAVRDQVLGVRGVGASGAPFKAGGTVVKNVTGFDLSKVLCGAWGTLAVLGAVSLKTLPRPETSASLVLCGLEDGAAVAALAEALGSAHEVSGAAHLPAWEGCGGGPATCLRLEGPAPSVAYRLRALKDLLAPLLASGGATRRADMIELDDAASRALWAAIGAAAPLAAPAERLIWRLSVAPAAGPAVVAAVRAAQPQAEALYDWGGGLIWLALPATLGDEDGDGGAALVRAAVAAAGGGHAMLFRAPEALRARVPVFQPQPPGLAALSRRLKQNLDPAGILSPGRMVEGW